MFDRFFDFRNGADLAAPLQHVKRAQDRLDALRAATCARVIAGRELV